jgi:Thrombospondin type 3 repeat
MRGAWLVVVAGCYSASPPSGAPCDPVTPSCPAGQQCVSRGGQFVCDTEPGDDASMLDGDAVPTADDVDGDGVANANDNCPMIANANQANEDADAAGDVCDNCPPFPSTGADADADGVGDLCDPHVLIPGDSLALFEGFANGIPVGWTASGTWTVQYGNLLSAAPDDNLHTMVIPYANTANQTISAFATITALANTNDGSIGIADRFDGNQGLHCGGGRAGGERFGVVNAATGVFLNSKPHPFDTGTLYRLTFTRTGKAYDCETVQASGSTVKAQADFDVANGPNIGFRNRTASASFPWIMVVKSP